MLAGQISFGLSVLLAVAVVLALGPPRRYPDHGVAWYLVAAAWSALLIDGLFLLALLGFARGLWVSVLLLVFVNGRSGLSLWLLWMIVKARRRT